MITQWFGTFLIDDSGNVEKSVLFPKDEAELGGRLQAVSENKILDEERELVEGYQDLAHITLTEDRLSKLFRGNVEINEALSGPEPGEFGFDYELLHKAAVFRSKEQLVGDIDPDKLVIHAINSINELNHTANLLSERLHEWYGLHWPEFTSQVNENEYLDLILEFGTREDILDEKTAETDADYDTVDSSSEALGGPLNDRDIAAIQGLAMVLKNVYSERDRLERYVRAKVEEMAPNASKVAGSLITAKLISLTGGIERLSRVSASTIQLLGAEKALFRHLKDGSSPPKHGVIFQHPLLHAAPHWQRGKIARALATKISIAIKIDYYKGEFQGDRLEQELQKRIDDIRKKFPTAPSKSKQDHKKTALGKTKKPGKGHLPGRKHHKKKRYR